MDELRVRTRWLPAVCMALAMLAGECRAQMVRVQGTVWDAFLKVPLAPGRVAIYEADSVSVAVDSAAVETILDEKGAALAVLYRANVPAGRDYVVRAMRDGYGDEWQRVAAVGDAGAKVSVPAIRMRRVAVRRMGEVEVRATRVKMYCKGDTIVYNADAFSLPEGSMLDDLIRQMPGVTMNEHSEIFVNGRKVDELLLGSRTFFGGNSKVMLENLPYYTVRHIKVYDRESGLSRALGYEASPRQYVMDVILREEYNHGYIANAEGAAGSSSRWLGRAFLLGYTDRLRLTLVGNANNVNETRHVGESGHWTPARMPRSLTTVFGAAAEVDYHSPGDRLNETFRAEYRSVRDEGLMRQNKRLFVGGVHPTSFLESGTDARDWGVTPSNNLQVFSPFYLVLGTHLSYNRHNGSQDSGFEQYGDSLTSAMRSTGFGERRTWNAHVDAIGSIRVARKSSVTYVVRADYADDKSESATLYETRMGGGVQGGRADVRRNANDFADRNANASVSFSYDGFRWGRARVEVSDEVSVGVRKTRDYLFHPDTLLLASQLEALTAITDPANSYDSRRRAVGSTLRLSFKHESRFLADAKTGDWKTYPKWHAGVKVPVTWQRLDYQRAAIDTTARHTAVFVEPWVTFRHIASESRHEVKVALSHARETADMTDRIPFRDDSHPLVVKTGGEGLQDPSSTSLRADYYNRTDVAHAGQWHLSAWGTYRHSTVAQAVNYNPVTGVTTYRPTNVGGAFQVFAQAEVSRSIDSRRHWTWQTQLEVGYNRSVDHARLDGETESRENVVGTWVLRDNAYVQYSRGTFNVRASGDVRWRRSGGRMRDFTTLSVVDFQYGLAGRYTIPSSKTTMAADATMYSRRGYGNSALNTDNFVLCASVSQSLLGGRLILSVEAFDLLHQLSPTQYEVNAQGSTETWYRSLPRYVMAHVVFHWSRNPKRK